MAANSAPESVVTSLAGFAQAGSSSLPGRFPPPESVITSLAGFAGAAPSPTAGWPQGDPGRFQIASGGFAADAGGSSESAAATIPAAPML